MECNTYSWSGKLALMTHVWARGADSDWGNRKEAATHARVYRARANPYAEVQDDTRRVVPQRVHSSRPSEEWRNAFIEKFKQTRMVRFDSFPLRRARR